MVEKILNNTTPYRKIRASHEGSLHSSTLNKNIINFFLLAMFHNLQVMVYMFDNLQICSPPLFSLCIYCKKSVSMSHGKEYKRYELIGTLRKCFSRNSYDY